MLIIIENGCEDTTFSIDVQLSDIVATLKKKIESDKEFEADGQCLSFNGILLDDYRTLSHYGIEDGSVINMAFQSMDEAPQKGKFPVTALLTSSHTNFMISVRLSDTIGQLKLRINEIKGFPPEDQCIHLFGSYQYLKDNMTLAEVNFREYTKFNLTLVSEMQICLSKKARSAGQQLFPYMLPKFFDAGGIRVFIAGNYYYMKTHALLIYINPSETIEELKLIVLEKTGIKVEHQDIGFEKIKTLEDCRTLAYYGVVNNSGLYLNLDKLMRAKGEVMLHKSSLHPDDIQIFVQTLTGKNFPIKGQSSNTIEELKFKIQDREGVPPDESRLIFRGILLNDERTVADYNITNNSKVDLVLKLRGD